MAYRAERFPGEIHFYAATLNDPTQFKPEFHVHWAEKLDWLHVTDDLPKYPGSANDGDPI